MRPGSRAPLSRVGLWSLGALGLALLAVAPDPAAAQGVAAGAEPLAVGEVAPGIYVHQGPHEAATPANLGGYANIGFIVGEEAVAVVDSGGSAAQGARLRAAVREVTDLPIKYVILTHVHPDHMLGSAAFKVDRPEFVGHHRLARAMAARGPFYVEALERAIGDAARGTEIVLPTVTVEGELEIDLGRRRLRLIAQGAAHTDNDLAVYDTATGTLWASDLLFVDRIPVVDGSLTGWLSVMGELRRIPARRAIPGHGPPAVDWPAALDAQETYLSVLRDEIREIIARNGTMEEAVATVGGSERDKWLLFEDYHARNVVTAFAELEWE